MNTAATLPEIERLPRTELLAPPSRWTLQLPRGRTLTLGARPRVMGVLNLTPDSFSDGGLWADPTLAVEHGLAMLAAGADLLDLGAESTRPGGGVYGSGASDVPAAEESRRLLPVLHALRAATDAPLAVDTRKGEVAAAALASGADLINDVAALADPALAAAVAAAGCPIVLMHSRGEIATMQHAIEFGDVVGEVGDELEQRADAALKHGIAREQLILDPGIGFGKTAPQNLALIRHAGDLQQRFGRPLLLGASRKSFIGRTLESGGHRDPGPSARLGGSLAAVAWAAARGIALVRVHDVAATIELLTVWQAIAESA